MLPYPFVAKTTSQYKQPGQFARVYYHDGSGDDAHTNEIIIKTNLGGDGLHLFPGQANRLQPGVTVLFVENANAANDISGTIYLGSVEEEFENNRLVGAVAATQSGVWTVTQSGVWVMSGTLGQIAQQALVGVNAAVVTERGFAYATAFASTTVLAGGTPENVWAAASNTAGATIWEAEHFAYGPVGSISMRTALLCKATAPASVIDGDVMLVNGVAASDATNGFQSPQRMARSRAVATGKRGDWISTGTESNTLKKVLYSLG